MVIGALALVILLSLSLAIVYFNRNHAFVYVSILWLAAGVFFFFTADAIAQSWVLFAGILFFVLGILEAYFGGWFSKRPPQLLNYSISDPSYFQPHAALGYGPRKGIQVKARKNFGNQKLYDVVYSINHDGLRMGFEGGDNGRVAALFFGCSYTFGEGVNDDETLPYVFEERSQGRFKAVNLGFHGYGPQQMLAVLENELEKPIVGDHRPGYAIYQAITPHVHRCAGRVTFEKSGPRYVLDGNGEPAFTRPFNNKLAGIFMSMLSRSHIARRFLTSTAEITSADIDLFVAIVRKSAEIFGERYGGVFYVLYWMYDKPWEIEIVSKLTAKGIKVIDVREFLPDHITKKEKYRIPYDYHPNPLAYEKIAEYLLAKLGVALPWNNMHQTRQPKVYYDRS